MRSGHRAPRTIGIVVGLFVAGFAVSLVPAAIGAIALGRLGYGLDSSAFVVVSLVASAIGFGVVGTAYAERWLHGIPLVVPNSRDLRWVAVGTVGSLVLSLGLQLIYEALAGPAGAALVTNAIVSDPGFAAVYAVVSLVVVAPGEEILFRGAIQNRLVHTFHPNVAIVGASVLFAAPHFFNIVGAGVTGLFAAVTIFLVSLIWGTAFERTNNLTVPILIHGLYNAGLAGVGYLSVVGYL